MSRRAFIAESLFVADASDPLHGEVIGGEVAVVVDLETERITAVGPASEVAGGAEQRVETDGVLLPGLIDMHTHVCLSASQDPGKDAAGEHLARIALRGADNLRLQLDAGVTTIRDVGGVGGVDLELMRMVDEGVIEGPQVFAAGQLLCMTGGHACFLGVEVDGADAVRNAARRQLKNGARLLKVVATGGVITPGVRPGAAQLTEDEMRAACEEAHKADKRVAAHAQGSDGIDNALRAGVDTIEHGFWLSDFALSFMPEHDRSLVPTFAALRAMRAIEPDLPAFIAHKLDEVEAPQLRSFLAAVAAGVRVVTGTDAGTPGNPHGNISDEISAFAEAGVPALDCWRAATSWAADALGQSDRGLLAPGRRGDVIAIDAAALVDPTRYVGPKMVARGGIVVRREGKR